MIINADSLLPHLKALVRPTKSDLSRHLLCPDCGTRTKLNTLGDGRRKCSICGKKFRVHKSTDETKLQQCSEILLCFCLDFTAQTTAQITCHRYRLVALYYDHFRRLLTKQDVPAGKKTLLHLKELQWKETHRHLAHDVQAKKIIELMPKDFLTLWMKVVQSSAKAV